MFTFERLLDVVRRGDRTVKPISDSGVGGIDDGRGKRNDGSSEQHRKAGREIADAIRGMTDKNDCWTGLYL
jgi:hypothetical protein